MTTINPTDPRLTAFVLGELSAEEAGDIQTALDQSVELQTEAAAIREIAAQIETAMREEDVIRARGVSQGSLSTDTGPVNVRSVGTARVRRLTYIAAITAVAASLVVALALPLILNTERGTERSAGPRFFAEFATDELLTQPSITKPSGDYADVELSSRSAPGSLNDYKIAETLAESTLSRSGYDTDGSAQQDAPEAEFAFQIGKEAATVASEPAAPVSAPPPPASGPLRNEERLMEGLALRAPLAEQLKASQNSVVGGHAALMGGVGAAPQSAIQPALPTRPESSPPPQMPTMQPSNMPLEPFGAAPQVDRLRESEELGQRDSTDRHFVQMSPPGDGSDSAQEPLQVSTFDRLEPLEETKSDEKWGKKVEKSRFVLDKKKAVEPVKLNDSFNNARAEAYKDFTENDFTPVKISEFSTFSIDVDTASYATMRRYVKDMNQRPPVESVRLEEYLNYFTYDYAQPDGDKPFATHVEVFPCPWQSEHLLARIGIKGKEYTAEERPPLNLVFLIDVSGSMAFANRLPLVKRGLADLVEMLQPKDRVAIVTYAGNTQMVLPSVSGQEKRAILDSINALNASGSTAGASGIKLAYETARRYYDKEAQNRVILCTDGDFNVGTTDNKTLEQMIGEEAKSGVFLTILGFGMGNIKDDRLKTLSMRGDGNYGYIDSIEECQKLLVEGLTSTLFTIAKDVKIQVDFNPAHVAGYRLLGYENRKLRDEDFHNDAVDAGDIGAGHTVTALYELVPVGVRMPQSVDRSRYATEPVSSVRESLSNDTGSGNNTKSEFADELMFVKLRYKEPDGDKSSLLEFPVKKDVKEASGDSQFASAVALYGMLLRSSRHSGNGTWDAVLELAMPNTMEDKYREEFIELVRKAKELR